GDPRLPIILFGLGLMAIGGIGVFFGRLIKAAVSRQRELLADSASVQFTRNPSGIAGALKKIGGLAEGSKIENGHVEEANHLFFGQVFTSMASMMATHPPLAQRIRRLEPGWTGELPQIDPAQASAAVEKSLTEGDRPRGFADPRELVGMAATVMAATTAAAPPPVVAAAPAPAS